MKKQLGFELTTHKPLKKVKDAMNLWRQGKLFKTLIEMGYDRALARRACFAITERMKWRAKCGMK